MDKELRAKLESFTREARRSLEVEFRDQMEGPWSLPLDGTIPADQGVGLSEREQWIRRSMLDAMAHKRASGFSTELSARDFLRDCAFSFLNRIVALRSLEERKVVPACVSRGEESPAFLSFLELAPTLQALSDKSQVYRHYLECVCDEMAHDIARLFDRQDPSSLLWPRRAVWTGLLESLNAPELTEVWKDDETLGWVYQYFNSTEERKAMRKAASAPRDSRELAIRNQFFTPKYVVGFLSDNSLGRLWWDMTQGRTALSDQCPRMIRTPTTVPQTRPLKDPRDLRVIDPACGSGHYLLHVFGLLETIYREAWDLDLPPSEVTTKRLRDEFPDPEDYRLQIPRLILEHNLHGVDIDPRCAQIACLALWMRAQRAWLEQGVTSFAKRPRVGRIQIVIAEPMPGEPEEIRAFREQLDPPLLGELFESLVKTMRPAGELGLLLRSERELEQTIQQAQADWNSWKSEEKDREGFMPGLAPERDQKRLALFEGLDEEGFFQEAESRILNALRDFGSDAGTVRTLFAADAVQGLQLLELARKRYDVVLMNPPFGEPSKGAKGYLQGAYPRTKNDLYAAFVERGLELLQPGGRLGAITSRTGFFLTTFRAWREQILLQEAKPIVMLDLGAGVLDSAMVETAAYVLEKPGLAAIPLVEETP